MKRTLLFIACILCVLGATAQDWFDSGTNHTRFGVRLSWDLNTPSTSFNNMVPTYHSGSGLCAGAFINIPLFMNAYIEPGVGVYYNTMVISQNIRDDIELDYPLTPQGSLRNSGFRIPMVFGFRFDVTDDVAISVFTGPQINVGLTLQQYVNSTHDKISLYDHGWHRVDAQWLFGVRFYYSDNWICDISGGIGMTNMADGAAYPGQTFRRNTFSIGVGYLF